MNIFRFYNFVMNKYPIRTQCVTTGILVASGDIIAQKLIEKQEKLNKKRTIKFAIFGLFFIGPSVSLFYRFLERGFGKKKRVLLRPWEKVVIDQSIFSPNINFGALIVLGLLDRKSPLEIKQNIQQNYFDIMITSYKVWPAFQMFNFYLTPVNYRPVAVALFSLAWNSYYTWKLGEKTVGPS